MYRLAIIKIQKYIDQCLPVPPSTWPKYYFIERSSARWAAKELIKRLSAYDARQEYCNDMTILWVIDNLHADLDRYSEIQGTQKRDSFWFATARDSIMDLKYSIFKK